MTDQQQGKHTPSSPNEIMVTVSIKRIELAALGLATASYLRIIDATVPATLAGRTEVVHFLRLFQEHCHERVQALEQGAIPESEHWITMQVNLKEIIVFGTAVEAYGQAAGVIHLPYLPYASPDVVMTHIRAFLQRSMHLSKPEEASNDDSSSGHQS